MAGLEKLQQEVEKCLEHMRSESEHLMLTDETLRHQRCILQSTFQELEQKQVLLQAKGECPVSCMHLFKSLTILSSASRVGRHGTTFVTQHAQCETACRQCSMRKIVDS
jgi:hypothetical protein